MSSNRRESRLAKWRQASVHYLRGTWYCFKLCPWATLGAFLLYFVIKIMMPLVVWAQSEAVAFLGRSEDLTELSYFIFVLAVLCISTLLYKFRGYIVLPVNRIIESTVSVYCTRRILQGVNELPLISLDTEAMTTRIERAKEKAEDLQTAVMMLADTVGGIVTMTTFAIIMLTYEYGIFYLLLAIVIGIVGKMFSLNHTEKETELNINQTLSRRKCNYLFELQTERTSMMELKIDKAYAFLRNKWRYTYVQSMQERLALKRWWIGRTLFSGGLAELFYAVVLATLSVQVINHTITLAGFVYLSGAVIAFSQMLDTMIRSVEFAYKEGATLKEMQTFVKLGEDADKKAQQYNETVFKKDAPCLELRNVSFSYDGVHPVLRDINFTLGKNEIIALVGPNGGGKSTLMKMALGLLEPNSGQVYLKGVPISEVDTRQRVDLQGVVFQDYMCYKLPIRDNIGFGCLEKLNDDHAIIKAMRQGESDKLLNRAKNLDAFLGRDFDDAGLELSGGEWQRVAISRAFMGDHQMIVFDEPSSAIDPLAELHQFERLRQYLLGKSGILVTHRIGLAGLADRIVYLEDGLIMEQGTHEVLMSMNVQYASLFNEQAKWYDFADKVGCLHE